MRGSMATPAEFEGCKALYVGNLHPYVNEVCLQDLFSTAGTVIDIKLVKDKATGQSVGSAFVKFEEHHAAAVALQTINGHCVYGKELRVSWAFQKDKAEDTATHFHIFVGNLSGNVTDPTLLEAFKAVGSCSDARVMWDHATGRSKGYGFVSFRTQEDAERAIQTMNGMVVGQWRVRCGWANHKQETVGDMDAETVDKADPTNSNVYVGNLSAEVDDAELKRRFARFGAVSGVKACLKGGYGFVQFAEHAAAVAAIVEMNGRQLGGKTLKCAWGRHQNRAAQAPAPASLPPPPLPIHPVAAQGLLRLGMLGAPVGGAAAPTSTGFLGPAVAGVQVLPIHMEAGAAGAQLGAPGSEGFPMAFQPAAHSAALYGIEPAHAAPHGVAYAGAPQGMPGARPRAGAYLGAAPMQPRQQAAALQAAVSQPPCGSFPANLALGFKGALDAGGIGAASGAPAGGFHLNPALVLPDAGLMAGGVYRGQPLTAAVSPALFAEQQYLMAAAYGAQVAAPAPGQGGAAACDRLPVPSALAVSEAEFSQLYYSQYYNQP